MKEWRCKFCHRLLFKYNPETESFDDEGYDGQPLYKTKEKEYKNQIQRGVIEVKCSKCKTTNKIPAQLDLKDWQFVYGSAK